MYGTVGRIRIKAGSEKTVIDEMKAWERERKPKVDGAVGALLYKSDDDPQNLTIAIVFRDQKTYMANADDPEQDKWFQRIAKHFDGEPSWFDGEIIYSDGIKG